MKLAIIGGGITGLTSALALHKAGISSVVYEQVPEFNEIGAGIWIQPNAVKVFEWLGMKDEIKKLGIELEKMEITNKHLKTYKNINPDVVQDKAGNKTIAIHRGRLHKALFDAVSEVADIKLNFSYINHNSGNGFIKIKFQHSHENADILLGADGIHSSVRKILFPGSSLRSAGQVCWRGVSKTKLPDYLLNRGKEAWGDKIRFGFSRIAVNEVYWFAVAREEHLKKAIEIGQQNYLHKLFHDFSPLVHVIIDNTDPSTVHQTILNDLKRLDNWYYGNVCLLGDAAHATTPNMGQGACQGIEDAFYLSHYLPQAKQNIEAAFEMFQRKRRKKVDYIVNNSWMFGKMAHSKPGQAFMKIMFKITPESVMSAQMNRLYSIDLL